MNISRLRIILLLIRLSFSSVVSGQNHEIDSLKTLLQITSQENYVDVKYELARAYLDVDNETSLKYANEAMEQSKKIGDSLMIVRTARTKSQALRKLGKIDSSIILYLEVLPVATRHNYASEIKSIQNGLGLAHVFNAQYDKALKHFFESLELRQQGGDETEIGICFGNIALVYYKLKDYDKAVLYYKKSLLLVKDNQLLSSLYMDISLCYAFNNDFLNAKKFVKKGLSLCNDDCTSPVLYSARYNLGVISFGQENFSEAKRQFLSSYNEAVKMRDARFQLDNIIYLVQICLQENELKLAEEFLDKAEVLVASGVPYNLELIKVYSKFFTVLYKARDFEKVALYQNKYIILKDSIYSEELTTNLMKIEADHLEKENKAKIDSQNKILALNEEVIHRQRVLNGSIGVITLLVVILATVLAKNNRQKLITNRLLDERVKERTRELETNRDELQRVLQERDMLIHKASSDIQSSIATLKGLCFLGMKEVDHPKAEEYWMKLDTTSDRLSAILNKMFYSYKVNTPIK